MASILDKQEVSRARVGPRESKDPRSKAYAIQTLYALKRYAESLRCDRDLVAKELEEIERYRHWEILGYPSKAAMLKAELNESGRANIDALAKHGGDRRSEGREQVGNAHLKSNGSVERILARLKRDRPDLASEVVAERLTANAAAIEAGFRRATWSAPVDRDLLAAAIEKRYPGYTVRKK